MSAEEINIRALKELSKQNWVVAQQLFFQNAKVNPCHQTWNNLGYYLISEGIVSKSGSFRSAHKLGLKYLYKAAQIQESVVNTFALVMAIEYELRSTKATAEKSLYQKAYCFINQALAIEYSDVLEFNALRFSYLLQNDLEEILLRLRKLLKTYVCEESVQLYLELLRKLNFREEGRHCIINYKEYLDDADKLLFFVAIGDYDEGYQLCDAVYQKYSINDILAAAIIECCLGSSHSEEAHIYAQQIVENESNGKHLSKNTWITSYLGNLMETTSCRKKLITSYKLVPPLIPLCCYFGCKMHDTPWA